LIYRHLAWLTVLRYRLRTSSRVWESVTTRPDAEYRDKYYTVPESATPLDDELRKYLPAEEIARQATTKNKGIALIGAQSETIKDLYAHQELVVLHHTEM
jgi:ion channel-forming bestrophin family protein